MQVTKFVNDDKVATDSEDRDLSVRRAFLARVVCFSRVWRCSSLVTLLIV